MARHAPLVQADTDDVDAGLGDASLAADVVDEEPEHVQHLLVLQPLRLGLRRALARSGTVAGCAGADDQADVHRHAVVAEDRPRRVVERDGLDDLLVVHQVVIAAGLRGRLVLLGAEGSRDPILALGRVQVDAQTSIVATVPTDARRRDHVADRERLDGVGVLRERPLAIVGLQQQVPVDSDAADLVSVDADLSDVGIGVDTGSLVAGRAVPEVLEEPPDRCALGLQPVPGLPVAVDAGPLLAPDLGPALDEGEDVLVDLGVVVLRGAVSVPADHLDRVVVARGEARTPRGASGLPVVVQGDASVTLPSLVTTLPVWRRGVVGLAVLVIRDDLDALRTQPIGVVTGHGLDGLHPRCRRAGLRDVVDDRLHVRRLDRLGVDLSGREVDTDDVCHFLSHLRERWPPTV